MTNGCEKCAAMPDNELCPACEIEFLDWDTARNMKRIEELKEILKGEQNAVAK